MKKIPIPPYLLYVLIYVGLFLIIPVTIVFLFQKLINPINNNQQLQDLTYTTVPSTTPIVIPDTIKTQPSEEPSPTPEPKELIPNTPPLLAEQPELPQIAEQTKPTSIKMLKDVGEAYMDHFGLTAQDFEKIQHAGFNVIQSNFDICAFDEDVQYILDQSLAHNIYVILPAGSGEAEWGYECEAAIPEDQAPRWNKEAVQAWVAKWKSHPAVYAWDISNEAGGNFPNSKNEEFRLSQDQLQTAYKDVKEIDTQHPVMIRMNGWFFYDSETNFFPHGNPFSTNMADIVMINAYSNVDEYFPDFVSTVLQRADSATHQIDSHVTIIAALGIWEEPPLWVLPDENKITNDYQQAKQKNVLGIAYFKYGAQNSEWYLPEKTTGSKSLWELIASLQYN